MRPFPRNGFRPGLERLEEIQPLTAGLAAGHAAALLAARQAQHASATPLISSQMNPPAPGIALNMDRITNPTDANKILQPPFQHVILQDKAPVPGQTYNVMFISVWNGTNQTFTAADNLRARLSTQSPGHDYPILTGNQVWKPGDRIVFYILTKKYYPLAPTASAGFKFNFVNPRVTAIPGPSGIFLRVKYNPATFNKVLDAIVVSGKGARGSYLGLPDTAIWEILPAYKPVLRL